MLGDSNGQNVGGDHVYLQNLVGNYPKKWERTGTVVEVKQYHQYVVRVDGSGRATLRNRQPLRRFIPFYKSPTGGTSVDPNLVAKRIRDPSLHNEKDFKDIPPQLPPRQMSPPGTTPSIHRTPLDSSRRKTPAPATAQRPRPSYTPKRINFDAADQPGRAISPPMTDGEYEPPAIEPRMSRALARLQPYNKAGKTELLSPRRPGRNPRDCLP